jgi:hypothetical protein
MSELKQPKPYSHTRLILELGKATGILAKIDRDAMWGVAQAFGMIRGPMRRGERGDLDGELMMIVAKYAPEASANLQYELRELLHRPVEREIDWGEVDDELHDITARYMERRDGADTEQYMSEMRALLRKVSGQ